MQFDALALLLKSQGLLGEHFIGKLKAVQAYFLYPFEVDYHFFTEFVFVLIASTLIFLWPDFHVLALCFLRKH